MVGVIYEHSIWAFLMFTIVLGGAASFQTGRAVAQTWQPVWQLLPYAVLLAVTVRFLYFAVLEQTLLSWHYFLVDLIVLTIAGYLGWRLKRVTQMTTQYGWLYEASGSLGWRSKS